MLLQLAYGAKKLTSATQMNHLVQCSRLITCKAASQQGQLSSNWRDLLVALSSLSICVEGHVQQLVTLSRPPPAAAAATAAGSALAFLRLGGSSSNRLSSSHQYWMRQAGFSGSGVTPALIAVNVAAFGMQMLSPAFTLACARVGYRVAAGEYWRLLTASFLHANFIHLGVNMLALWNLGRYIEHTLGSKRFLYVYLGSCLTANLTGYVMGSNYTAAVGASGGLVGLFGGYLMYKWMNRRAMPISSPEMNSILQTLGLNLLLMTVFAGSMDHWGHLGGLVGGAALMALLGPKYTGRW